MSLLYILVAILALALMIFIHELGHYTAGRILGFKILDFSIGFGPAIFKFEKNGIKYALRAIPLGGACRFYGEDDEPMDAVAFNAQKVWKRIIVVLAGPIMNVATAYILAFILMLCYGQQRLRTYESGQEVIGIVDFAIKDSPAEISGIEKGDIILEIEGESIENSPEGFEEKLDVCSEMISQAQGSLELKVMRDGEIVDITVNNIFNDDMGKNYLGIAMGYVTYFQPYSFFESFGEAGKLLVEVVKATAQGIANMFTSGVKQGDVTGVVGTVAIMSELAAEGFFYLLYIIAVISLSLGLFNLIPFPALDGGRFIFMLFELITGRSVNKKIEGVVHMIGMLLLFGLMIVITISDIMGISKGLF